MNQVEVKIRAFYSFFLKLDGLELPFGLCPDRQVDFREELGDLKLLKLVLLSFELEKMSFSFFLCIIAQMR